MILVDAYSNQMYIPFQLASREFMELARSKLAPGGVFCINVVDLAGEGPLLERVRNTVASSFGAADEIAIPGGMNRLIFATKGPPPEGEEMTARISRASFASRPESGDLSILLRYAVKRGRRYFADPAAAVITDDLAPMEYLADSSFRRAREELGLSGLW